MSIEKGLEENAKAALERPLESISSTQVMSDLRLLQTYHDALENAPDGGAVRQEMERVSGRIRALVLLRSEEPPEPKSPPPRAKGPTRTHKERSDPESIVELLPSMTLRQEFVKQIGGELFLQQVLQDINLPRLDGICIGEILTVSKGRMKGVLADYYRFATRRDPPPLLVNISLYKADAASRAKSRESASSGAAARRNFSIDFTVHNLHTLQEMAAYTLAHERRDEEPVLLTPIGTLWHPITTSTFMKKDIQPHPYAFSPTILESTLLHMRGETAEPEQGELSAAARITRMEGGEDIVRLFEAMDLARELEIFIATDDLDVLLKAGNMDLSSIGILTKRGSSVRDTPGGFSGKSR